MKKGLLILVVLTLMLAACGGGGDERIVVSGKKFTEQVLLAEIISQLLEERTDLDIVNRGDLGSTDVLHRGMLDGDIDIYVEYTGTAYMIVLKHELENTDPDYIYQVVKEEYADEFDMTWLEPFQFNNTYALALRGDHAAELGVETYTDLVAHAPQLTFGSDNDFFEREDGFDNLNLTYGFEWGGRFEMDPGLMYAAVRDGDVDVITAFATDGRIPRYNLKILEDDLNYFPPYFAAPVVRMEVLDKHPEIADILNELAPHLTMEKMAELNSRVDIDGEMESSVARDFLLEVGLITE
jgi:osmoprotectant transport system substrate-binding protein